MQRSNKHISCYTAQYTLSIESNQTETYSIMPECHGHVPVFDDQDLMAECATIKNIPRPHFL